MNWFLVCLDILAIVPDHQQALISLLLVRTDQFQSHAHAKAAQEVLAYIKGDYERLYYQGIILERLGNAHIRNGGAGAGAAADHSLRAAMDHFEKAMNFAIPGNDDAILRWNTCARVIMQDPNIRPVPETEPAQAWERDQAGSRIADA